MTEVVLSADNLCEVIDATGARPATFQDQERDHRGQLQSSYEMILPSGEAVSFGDRVEIR